MPDNYLIDDPSIPLISMKEILKDLMWYGKGPIFVLIGSEFLSRKNIDDYLNKEMGDGMKIYELKIIEEKYKDDLNLLARNRYYRNMRKRKKVQRREDVAFV